jgi:hypothetical protein
MIAIYFENYTPKNMAEERKAWYEILSTSGNTYTFEFGMVGNDQKSKKEG